MMRERAWRAGAAVLCCLFSGCERYRPDPQAIQRQVASAVPLHSDPPYVIAYLDRAKIAHSPYRRDKNTGNTVEAAIQVKAPHAVVDPSYDLVFRFNDQDQLTGCEVLYLGYFGL